MERPGFFATLADFFGAVSEVPPAPPGATGFVRVRLPPDGKVNVVFVAENSLDGRLRSFDERVYFTRDLPDFPNIVWAMSGRGPALEFLEPLRAHCAPSDS